MNDISEKLLAAQNADLELRTELAKDNSLYDGYHPKMQSLHERNAVYLQNVIKHIGWPSKDKVGQPAADAAWLIAQHAISMPAFQKNCLSLLKDEKDIPAWQIAMMTDRICMFENRGQIYGTQFDWDENGELSPVEIDDIENVDSRRASVGLPPLAEAIKKHRAENTYHPSADDVKARRKKADLWAKRAGWR